MQKSFFNLTAEVRQLSTQHTNSRTNFHKIGFSTYTEWPAGAPARGQDFDIVGRKGGRTFG